MRIGLLLGCVLLATAAVAEDATVQSDKTAETRIIALENAWNQAQLNHDARALDALITDSFVYTDYDGTVMDKRKFLADAKDASYHATLVANQSVKVYIYQAAAVVTGTYHTKGTYKGRPFEHWGRFTDTWLKENATWQCVASHTNLIKK